jgi:hypothetical protein
MPRKGSYKWVTAEVQLLCCSTIQDNGCITWNNALDKDGYAQINRHKWALHYKINFAHQLSYVVTNGEYNRELLICHTCDVRNCINPQHLFLGTAADNSQDRNRKGRQRNNEGENCGTSKLVKDDIIAIRCIAKYGVSHTRVATYFKVGRQSIDNIINRKTWKHI